MKEALEKYNDLIEYSDTLAKSKFEYKIEWDAYLFMLFDKMYGLLGINNKGELILTLKGPIEENEFLVKSYHSISPGYYMNKKHWYSISLNENEFNEKELENFLAKSYELIKDKLPKKIKNTL